MPADIQCQRCQALLPQSAYEPNRASITGFSLTCGACTAAVRTGPVETALSLLRRGFVRISQPQDAQLQ